MSHRDWSDVSGFPADPTPAEVAENVRQCAEAIVANCRALPSLTTVTGRNSLHECNAILGRLVYERSKLLRGGKGAEAL